MVVVEGYAETMSAIQDLVETVKKASEDAIYRAGLAYQGDVQAGAPVNTGQYRGSIHTVPPQWELGGTTPFVLIGTDLPQARRLEYGFWDMTDILGRHFWQYPRPHFRPPLDTQWGKYLAIMKGDLDAALAYGSYSAGIKEMIGLEKGAAASIGMLDTSMSMQSVSSRTSVASRFSAIGGSMQGDFGGFE